MDCGGSPVVDGGGDGFRNNNYDFDLNLSSSYVNDVRYYCFRSISPMISPRSPVTSFSLIEE